MRSMIASASVRSENLACQSATGTWETKIVAAWLKRSSKISKKSCTVAKGMRSRIHSSRIRPPFWKKNGAMSGENYPGEHVEGSAGNGRYASNTPNTPGGMQHRPEKSQERFPCSRSAKYKNIEDFIHTGALRQFMA